MPVAVDEITRKKLILVKQMYQQGVFQATRQGSRVGKVMSVVAFDLAIETVLKAAIGALDTSKLPSETFEGLIQQVDALLSTAGLPPVPDKANIRHVHSLRNDAQHKGKYPGDLEVSDCRTYARDFLERIVADVWALGFDALSLTGAIRHAEVRNHLIEAEAKLSQGDHEDAVKAANVGLTSAIRRVRESMVGRQSHIITAFVVQVDGRKEEADAATYRAFMQMQETLLYVALGIDYSSLMRFRAVAGEAHEMLDGSWGYMNMKERVDANDAEFAVAYCIDAVVQIENVVGDLEAPFGRSRWDWY